MLHLVFVLLCAALASPVALAQTIYPLDRAEILSGARFDLKVEMPEDAADADAAAAPVEITINGRPATDVLGRAPLTVPNEDGNRHTAVWLRDATLTAPGTYRVVARRGAISAEVTWEVFETPPARARNVILFVADGLSNAHRVAARILSKGIRQGRYGGELAIDDMPHMALVSTAGTDSIITDSANSASAYTTGHKTCTAAIGVYCARNTSADGHPKVELLSTLARRLQGKSVGVVTNTDIQDATPAAFYAHTRDRRAYARITEMLFEAAPEVILGGGSASFLPAPTGRRTDNVDYLARFEVAGYRLVATGSDMTKAAADPATRRLLGLFNTGNMDGALDRRQLKKGTVSRFPEQPDLVEQVQSAIALLERTPQGFVLLVESGMIDKYAHALDWERSVFDTIMLDNAVAAAKAWAAPRNDTLIVVVPDHTHPVSIIGTYDDSRPGTTLREKLGIYQHAGFPAYAAPDADGYPPSIDVGRRLAFTFSAYPDHCDAGRPFLANPNKPGDEQTCAAPGAARRIGNLPTRATSGVHSGEDVILTATGPGADQFRGRIDNTRVFRALATALGLGVAR
jgi:alkaline phosphatase